MRELLRKRLGHTENPRMQVPEFTVTSHGIRCRLPVIEDRAGDGSFSVGVLACQHVCSDTGIRTGIGLVLQRTEAPGNNAKSAQYHAGLPSHLKTDNVNQQPLKRHRLLIINPATHDLAPARARRLALKWRKLYLAQPPQRSSGPARVRTIPLRFLFPAWLLVELDKRGFRAAPAPAGDKERPAALRTPVLYTRWHMRSVVFANAVTGEAFAVQLGRCEDALWATVSFTPAWGSSSTCAAEDEDEEPEEEAYPLEVHQYTSPDECERHHISCWPDGSKTFGDADRSVRLTFSRRQQEPDDLYVVDVQLAGRVYTRIRRVGRVFHPEQMDVEQSPTLELGGVFS